MKKSSVIFSFTHLPNRNSSSTVHRRSPPSISAAGILAWFLRKIGSRKENKESYQKRMDNIKKVDGELSTREIRYSIKLLLTNTEGRLV